MVVYNRFYLRVCFLNGKTCNNPFKMTIWLSLIFISTEIVSTKNFDIKT